MTEQLSQEMKDKKEELLQWADDHANVIENEWMINLTVIKARIEMAFNSLTAEPGCKKCGSKMKFDYDESAWWCQNDDCDYGITNPRQED